MKNFRRTNIVGTIGPASENEEIFTKLVEAGLNVARINFSHGGFEENKEKIETIKRVRTKLNKPVGLMLDTKGPEIRTGVLETGNEKILIEEGQTFRFVIEEIVGNNTKVTIGYKDLYKDVIPGAKILVDDGCIEFEVTEIQGTDIVCKALNTGKLGSRKTVNVPGLKLNLPALSPKDIEDITKGVEAGFDFIAASFVRRASDVQEIRNLLNSHGGERVQIISKIESQEGINDFEEILALSDGIMVARGDMGVEIPMEQVPVVQKHFIKRCNAVGKPVITATQMLESMITNPRPTRAEVSDVANAIYDGSSGIMLSGETASGSYPVECVKTMNKIAIEIESSIKYWKRLKAREYDLDHTNCEFIMNYAVCITAMNVNAKAIIAYTNTGNTARMVSSFGPGCPVFAITQNETTYRQLGLCWGIIPKWFEPQPNIDVLLHKGLDKLKEENFLLKGDKVVIDGGTKVLTDVPTEDLTRNSVIGGVVEI